MKLNIDYQINESYNIEVNWYNSRDEESAGHGVEGEILISIYNLIEITYEQCLIILHCTKINELSVVSF